MPTPAWTRLTIGLAATVWFVCALLLDAPVDPNWVKPAGIVTAIVVLLLLAFDRWAWRWLPTVITGRPNLHGTWRGELHYQWPEGNGVQSKQCYLTIRQTYSSITVDMHFDRSKSNSKRAVMLVEEGRYTLWWSYWSSANPFERKENQPHRGDVELGISLKPALKLEGDYWTERKTCGRIIAGEWSRHIYDDFDSAEKGDFHLAK